MHPNQTFRSATDTENLRFARERGFGILSINGDPAPTLSHIPFLISDDGSYLEFHLVRSNPICRHGPGPAVIAISGPDGYVSPDWYKIDDQVPTWNYVAVHIRGQIAPLPQDTLHPILDRLTARFERELAPKTPWAADKMSDGVMEKMMRMIVPFRLDIESIDGTWKLGQNKTDAVRESAAKELGKHRVGYETALLAELMQNATR